MCMRDIHMRQLEKLPTARERERERERDGEPAWRAKNYTPDVARAARATVGSFVLSVISRSCEVGLELRKWVMLRRTISFLKLEIFCGVEIYLFCAEVRDFIAN